MIRCFQLVALVAVSLAAFAFLVQGGITITPAEPSSGDVVTIRLANRFASHASLASAKIARTSNTFTIVQNVNLGCSLPSNPLIVSEFEVGPLAPGTYEVVAHINFIDIDPGPCSPAPVTQIATFNTTHSAIPLLDPSMLALLAATLGIVGIFVLRRIDI